MKNNKEMHKVIPALLALPWIITLCGINEFMKYPAKSIYFFYLAVYLLFILIVVTILASIESCKGNSIKEIILKRWLPIYFIALPILFFAEFLFFVILITIEESLNLDGCLTNWCFIFTIPYVFLSGITSLIIMIFRDSKVFRLKKHFILSNLVKLGVINFLIVFISPLIFVLFSGNSEGCPFGKTILRNYDVPGYVYECRYPPLFYSPVIREEIYSSDC